MSIERTNRLRIALQKAKAGLSIEGENKSDNPSKLGRILNKQSTVSTKRGFIQSQPIHERPLMKAISEEVLGEDTEYQPMIELERSHPISRLKELRERNLDQTIPEGSLKLGPQNDNCITRISVGHHDSDPFMSSVKDLSLIHI